MLYLAYFIVAFSVIQLLVALVNLLFHQPFPRAINREIGLVSILIPARNEEKNIADILGDILKQDYQNIEIIVFNDQSTDRTEEIVTRFSEKDRRLRLISSEVLPDGWLGKNYACYSLSKQAKGRFLLFLDADVRIGAEIIGNATNQLVKYQLGLLSIFPKQCMKSIGEWITVPNMNYILLSLLPLVLVRKSEQPALSAANGQFMLFNSKIYNEMNPHERMKAHRVEDIEIARFYKENKIAIACLSGDDSITCRMYTGFKEAVNGFSKNVIHFFGNSFILALLFWLITTFGFFVVYFSLSMDYFIFFLSVYLSTRVVVSLVSRQNILLNIILFIPQQVTLGLFILKAFTNKRRKQFQWKGRNIT